MSRSHRTLAIVFAALSSIAPGMAGAQPASPPAPDTTTQGQGHTAHGPNQKPKPPAKPQEDHSSHQKPASEQKQYPAGIPLITDEDRRAAFPQLDGGHTVHDQGIHYFVLFDQLEWQGSGSGGVNIENTTWIGRDINRLWLRGEAESKDGDVDNLFVHALWGRAFSRWWDFVGGVRQDFRPGDPQTWAAVGIQGLAPQWFEVEATAYVGADWRTHARLEAQYDLLLTNRLILQPLVEVALYGKSDPERGIGAGLSTIETGLRLRYELRRELAPYAGLTWSRKFFGTADSARAEGEDPGGARFAVGIRTWF